MFLSFYATRALTRKVIATAGSVLGIENGVKLLNRGSR